MRVQGTDGHFEPVKEDDFYAIVCGYELTPHDIVKGRDVSHYMIVASDIPFVDAAHITRTLLEKGERDMRYYMVPAYFTRDDAMDAQGEAYKVNHPEMCGETWCDQPHAHLPHSAVR